MKLPIFPPILLFLWLLALSVSEPPESSEELIFQADSIMLNRVFNSVQPGDNERLSLIIEKLRSQGIEYRYELR